MNSILNRIVLILGLTAFALANIPSQKAALPIITAIALTGFLEYFNSNKLNLIGFLAYAFLSLIFPQFIFFLPMAFYDLVFCKYQYFSILAIIPLMVNIDHFTPVQALILLMSSVIEMILKHRTLKTNELYYKYIKQRDDLTEISITLENKIKELTDRQDSEVMLATLDERNRIAREIHDNVGHLLSSSILQIGAIMAITKEENTKASLGIVKNTLDTGMNSIRNSVHDLHEDSIDLYSQLSGLTKEFKFCSAQLNYEIEAKLDAKVKYAIIAIVKEALANVIKHSNASTVTVSLYEHPSLYQLIILDNGTGSSLEQGNGMGLESIRQRVNSLNGIVNINNEKGFKIFISFPNKDYKKERNVIK